MGKNFVPRSRGVGHGNGGLHRVRVTPGVPHPDDEVVEPPGHQTPGQDYVGLADFVVEGAGEVFYPDYRRGGG